MGPDAMICVFWMLSFKPTFSLSSFTFIKRLFSSSLLSTIRVVPSAYLRLLIFILAILIPACASSSPAFHMMYSAPAAAKSLQLCPTLCDPVDGNPPGSPVPGILQERTLEWVAISFSNGWKWKVKGNLLSCVRLLATPWTAAYQALPSMGFSRQEYWSEVPLPSPMYSAYKLNKQGDNIQPWCTPFPVWNQSVIPCPVLTVASWPAYTFLKRHIRWSGISISWKIFHSLFLFTQRLWHSQ